MADKYRAGGFGFGHAKIELLNKMIEVFGPMREKYTYWMDHRDDLRNLVQQGSVAVREKAVKKLDLLQQAMGLLGRPH